MKILYYLIAFAVLVSPIIPSQYAQAGPGLTMCIGAVVTLIDTAGGGTWSSSNPAVAIVSGGVVTGIALGVDTVTYSVPNACGGEMAMQVVSVNSVPTLSALTPSSTSFCAPNPIALTVATVTGTGSPTFAWSGPSGYTATGTSATDSLTPVDSSWSGVYSVTVKYPGLGCVSVSAATTPLTVANQGTITVFHLSDTGMICLGNIEDMSVSGMGGLGTATYRWRGPGIDSFVNTGSTASYSLSPTGTGAAYTVSATYPGTGCNAATAISATVTPTLQSWTGTFNHNWNDSLNWACRYVPLPTDTAMIGTCTYEPEITTGEAVAIKGLRLTTGSSLTIDAGATFTDAANLYNYGTILGAGTFIMSGSAAQYIRGNGKVNNIQIANANGVSIDSVTDSMTVAGDMQLTSGNFATGNSLILSMSDNLILNPDNGRIDSISAGGGSISGNVIIQQYVEGGRRAYRFWGTPFNDSIPLSQLEPYMDITGAGGTTHGFTTTATNAASAFWYHTKNGNSTVTGGAGDPGWKPFTWAADSMSGTTQVSADSNMVHRFEGFRLFFRGSKGEGLTGSTGYTVDPCTVRMWGPVNTGTVDVKLQMGTLTTSTGVNVQTYNQKSNPYPAPVDLGTVVYNAAHSGQLAQSTVWVWNPYGATAGMFVAVDETTLNPYIIPANTSYQVRAAFDNAVLQFNESNKAPSPSITLLKQVDDYVSLNVYDTSYHIWDMLKLKFDDQAKDVEENTNDAGKPVNPDLNFYSWSADRHPLSIDVRPFESGRVIPLGLTSNYVGRFIIKADDYHVPAGSKLYLHDRLLETFTLLGAGAEYAFDVTKDEATQGDSRFELGLETEQSRVTPATTGLKAMVMPNPARESVTVTFQAPASGETTLRMLSVEGVCVYTQAFGSLQGGSLTIPLSNISDGVYLIELTSGNEKVVYRLVKE